MMQIAIEDNYNDKNCMTDWMEISSIHFGMLLFLKDDEYLVTPNNRYVVEIFDNTYTTITMDFIKDLKDFILWEQLSMSNFEYNISDEIIITELNDDIEIWSKRLTK